MTDRGSWVGRFGALAPAGLCALAAGAIHGAAVGVHRQDRAAAATFAVLALAQLGWGLLALHRRGRALAAVGVALGLGGAGGWVLAKTRGISFVSGLGEVEAIQWSDATAAALAVATAVLALRHLAGGAASGSEDRAPRPVVLRAGIAVLTVVAMAAMVNAPGHAHGDHDEAGHDAGHGHDGSVRPAVPYDPTEPVDLSGAATVTPEEQARAEDLVRATLAAAPAFASAEDAEAAGYTSVGDGATGREHLVRLAEVDDDVALDPERPEGLVYDVADDGRRRLAALTYLLPQRAPLAEVPELGGAMTVWTLRRDLCRDEASPPAVRGRSDAADRCGDDLVALGPMPELTVWVVASDCGPFVAPPPPGTEADDDPESCGR